MSTISFELRGLTPAGAAALGGLPVTQIISLSPNQAVVEGATNKPSELIKQVLTMLAQHGFSVIVVEMEHDPLTNNDVAVALGKIYADLPGITIKPDTWSLGNDRLDVQFIAPSNAGIDVQFAFLGSTILSFQAWWVYSHFTFIDPGTQVMADLLTLVDVIAGLFD